MGQKVSGIWMSCCGTTLLCLRAVNCPRIRRTLFPGCHDCLCDLQRRSKGKIRSQVLILSCLWYSSEFIILTKGFYTLFRYKGVWQCHTQMCARQLSLCRESTVSAIRFACAQIWVSNCSISRSEQIPTPSRGSILRASGYARLPSTATCRSLSKDYRFA